MISFNTSRFGRLEVSKDKVIQFPNGLIGFSDIKRYILMDYKDTNLKWLQAIDNPDVAFIVMPPYEIFPEFTVKLDNAARNLLEVDKEDDLVMLTVLRVDGENVTANLQGPLIINSINRKGMQIVNEDSRFSCRTPLNPASSHAAQ